MYSDPGWDYYSDSLLALRRDWARSRVCMAGSFGAGWTRCHRNTDVGSAIKESQLGDLAQLVTPHGQGNGGNETKEI